ncbi:MAG: S-adenosylmethionine:tRNA ribosyltransferase-isomerase [Bacteroidales bacterium]|jgi:S-adenosylmethionine:tRNA ribosyltransferase-isomerase|nr:S-adenosylmethionine:tRNA ribosyltransferase-isomerase [Bacteroidales bacterium]
MRQIFDIAIDNFVYNLPEDRIAKFPLKKRDNSKLLVYKNGNLSETLFNRIADYIPANSLLFFNNTRVIQARLFFYKKTGARIELFCLEPAEPAEYELAFRQTEHCVWSCMVGNLKKWKGDELTHEFCVDGRAVLLRARLTAESGDCCLVEFSWDNAAMTFAEILELAGELPIPPYLNRQTEPSDLDTYQTVYSKINGSVAAPTAGLHFTDDIFSKLKAKGIACEELTLHVGAGTFRPVKTPTIGNHEMHAEFFSIKKESLQKLLNHTGKVIAVGTTCVRTLESLRFIGQLLNQHSDIHSVKVPQWMPYETSSTMSAPEAWQVILNFLEQNQLSQLTASTQIMIVPGYTFNAIHGIITNFHQPKSTLLLLVSAFLQGNWRKVYDYALSRDFRFLSYGDSSLLLP